MERRPGTTPHARERAFIMPCAVGTSMLEHVRREAASCGLGSIGGSFGDGRQARSKSSGLLIFAPKIRARRDPVERCVSAPPACDFHRDRIAQLAAGIARWRASDREALDFSLCPGACFTRRRPGRILATIAITWSPSTPGERDAYEE
jgi:hypothetical protein